MWDSFQAFQAANKVRTRLVEEFLRVVDDEITVATNNGLFYCTISVAQDWLLVTGIVAEQLETQGFRVDYNGDACDQLKIRWDRVR